MAEGQEPRVGQLGNHAGNEFGPGNQMAVKSGSRSLIRISAALPAEVETIRESLAESLPGLKPIDNLILEQMARTVIELRFMQQYVDDRGGSPIDSRGRPRAMWRQYNAAHSRLMKYAAMLGISPAARAGLMRDAGAGQRDYEAAQAAKELREQYTRPALPEGATDD